MKRILLIASLLLFVTGCAAQRGTYRQRISEAHGLALSVCIDCMNRSVDSLPTAKGDYSMGYFVQMSPLNLLEINQITTYVRDHWADYWAIPQEIGGNMIGYSAWKFSTSPELDRFIRQTVRRHAVYLPE